MPTIKLIPTTGIPDLLPMTNRSPGVHVSTIIHDLACNVLKHYKSSPLDMTRAQLGCALEHAIIHRYSLHYPGEYIQPGEIQIDNTFGTPDLYHTITNVAPEIKLSWMSSKHAPTSLCDSDKFWKFETQMKAYCHMLGITTSRLQICHIMGDYSYDQIKGAPTYRIWEYEFTRDELLQNWSMLRTHASTPGFRERNPGL